MEYNLKTSREKPQFVCSSRGMCLCLQCRVNSTIGSASNKSPSRFNGKLKSRKLLAKMTKQSLTAKVMDLLLPAVSLFFFLVLINNESTLANQTKYVWDLPRAYLLITEIIQVNFFYDLSTLMLLCCRIHTFRHP